MMIFTLPGEPIAMKRPRFSRGHAYNPQAKEKQRVQWEIKQKWASDPCVSPVEMKMRFYLKGRNKDIDNMAKFYLDAMQGVVFRNDNQVMDLSLRKYKATSEPMTVIEVRNENP